MTYITGARGYVRRSGIPRPLDGEEAFVGAKPVREHHEAREAVLEARKHSHGGRTLRERRRERLASGPDEARQRIERIAPVLGSPPLRRIPDSICRVEAHRGPVMRPRCREKAFECLWG